MDTPDLNSWPAKLVLRVGRKFRSNKSFTQDAINTNNARQEARRQKLREEHARKNGYQLRRSTDTRNPGDEVNELGERDYSVFSEATTLVPDHTDMLHGLAHHDSFDSLLDAIQAQDRSHDPYADPEKLRLLSEKHERMIDSLPDDIWKRIADFLTPADAAHLALTNKLLLTKLGNEPVLALALDINRHHRITFLRHMDRHLPRHLLCMPCGRYHLRLRPGKETYRADYVNNPLVQCPLIRASVLPRMRLTHGRELPYSFVQLALRTAHSPAHGIPPDALARRWTDKSSSWTHRTRYLAHDTRLLLRCVSQRVVPPAALLTKTTERHLLYDREEYTPFFSVCAHWQDGDLMDMCKCAMSHVPSPPQSYTQQLRQGPKIDRALARPNFLVRGCDWCRPARRCPDCPTEYLCEVQMVEDPADPAVPFKHALVVTRWSDLGDGTSPYTSREWVAVTGQAMPEGYEGSGYESFSNVGRRAVSGIFESKISGSVPGQRMVSLNPRNRKLGEEGHGWY